MGKMTELELEDTLKILYHADRFLYDCLCIHLMELEKEIVMLDGAVEQDQQTKDRYADEIKELISLNLWSVRRLKHQQYKDFVYDELEKITGQKHERV